MNGIGVGNSNGNIAYAVSQEYENKRHVILVLLAGREAERMQLVACQSLCQLSLIILLCEVRKEAATA